eukprot:Gb_13618 [translate_table: standard]
MMTPTTEFPTKSRMNDSTVLVLLGQMALKSTWTIFFFTSFFDVISFGLALGAQSRGNRILVGMELHIFDSLAVYWDFDNGSEYYYCKYNTDVASGMATGAFLFLLVGHMIVIGATRCFCCGGYHKPGAARLCAVILLSLSCPLFIYSRSLPVSDAHQLDVLGIPSFVITIAILLDMFCFIIAEAVLLAAAGNNTIRTRTRSFAGKNIPSCETIRSSIFGAAGAFTFMTWILSMLYYMFTVKSQEAVVPGNRNTGIA